MSTNLTAASPPTNKDECQAQMSAFLTKAQGKNLTPRMQEKLLPLLTAMQANCKNGKFAEASANLAQLEKAMGEFVFKDHNEPKIVAERKRIEGLATARHKAGFRLSQVPSGKPTAANKDECLVHLHGLILESRGKVINRDMIEKIQPLTLTIDEDCNDGRITEATAGLAQLVSLINSLPNRPMTQATLKKPSGVITKK